ncbi:pseudouridine synthase [Paenibacillus sp. CMAA1364]
MRINKFISETGFCSRREADKRVENGEVTINGILAVLGSQAEQGDDVRINGQSLAAKKKHIYIALNKPLGITCTTEQHIHGNIVDYVGHEERIFPIGRLDKDSEGLILLTNDGDIVNKVLRSEGKHEKEYLVLVDRPVTESFVRGMSSGVKILGEMTRPCEITKLSDRQFRIILTEGKNRQIRRMCQAFGYEVKALQRVRIMNIHLGDHKVGSWWDLNLEDKQALGKMLNYKLE